MTSLGFENYAEALKIYLSKYREVGRNELFAATLLVADADPGLDTVNPG